ncbi:hypothetical protein [Chryseobacterium luteum]|uniref:Uncharacterized protein n=1 Tax=Chryseobacterium luteum TaxID=421531 RepID=A0A085ZED6_9FLAO|nr:hypothetical protein [Chryseobacterium luteum]KFF02800.1 hypothetical protein IX38_12580 [Chryseobacterium luteum]
MKNIDQINLFKSTIKKTKSGTLTTLAADFGISAKESIYFAEKTLLTNYIYKKDETYNLVYTVIDNDGSEESFVEDDGILPTLFLSPDQENYVSFVPYDPNKDLEISIPVFNRENIELPKRNRPFVGDFIGTSNQYSIFHNADSWSDTKPDKLLAIEFKNGVIKKKHNVKIALPRNNKIFIQNNEIHLLAKDNTNWVHRQIDELGKLVRERTIKSNHQFFRQILSLSFEENSYILCEEKGKISIEIISAQNACNTMNLIEIGDRFYNTWQPVQVGEQTFITRFNNEFGNGWITTKNEQLLEIFYGKEEKGYKNLLTNEVLEMDHKDLVISSLNKTKENCYAVIFYPMANDKKHSNELIILNREIK